MNAAFANVAYHARLQAGLDGEVMPNREVIRERIRRSPASLRRTVFGQWRNRGR